MSLFKKKYLVSGWHGNTYCLTPKKLYERIEEDSKSDYNWITSATELVRICNQLGFPEGYAQKIKILILNCFANLETQKEYPGRRLPTDDEAVYSCFHSLKGADDDVVAVKQKYLEAIIAATIKYDHSACRFTLHIGPTYRRICEEWKKAKLQKYTLKEKIDFPKMRADLYADFDKTIKTAEDNGEFEEDDAKHREEMRKFWSSIDLRNL